MVECYGYINPWVLTDERTGDCKNCPAGHGWRGHINWPTESHTIHPGRGFQYGHPAIDIDTPIGAPVYAAETGVVIWAGWTYYGYGNLIILDHGRGYQTLYAHLEDVEIACNTTVMRGQHIGNVGMTGQSSFPHLHFEVRENRLSCDPFAWLEGTVPPPDNGEEEEMTLRNPSFEGITRPGGWTRDTHVGTEFGEIYVPEGWTAWWQEGAFRRPEMKVIQRVAPFLDPPRINEGNWAFQSFTMFGRQHCGLYQVIEGLTPGKTYKLSAQAHAWSLHPGIGEQSAYCSSGVGCGAVYIPEEDIPPLNDDPENDAIGNFVFRVGVSFEHLSPLDEVIWGAGACIYNAYHEVPPLRFIAPADGKITIYLCATSIWEFRNSDAYWDNVTLEEVDEVSDDRGKPRIQYERTYVLMHPEADEKWVEAVARATWNDHRYTIGGSADDAGIGDLDIRNVIAINPDNWGDLEAFYREYYPGINYTAIYADTPEDLPPFEPTSGLLLWQCDPKWKDEKVAGPDCSMTLCQTGCWISACAMVQRFFGIKSDATPSTANQALGAVGGFSGCNTRWSKMEPALGLKVVKKTLSDDEARQWLDTGNICFAEVEPETYMHFILVTRHQGNRFWMHDPYKNVEGWVDEYYPGVESWRLIRPFEPDPPPPPPPPVQRKTYGHISLHLQAMIHGYDAFIHDLKPPVVKVLASMQDVLGVKRECRDTVVVWRHVENDLGGVWDAEPHTGARNWIKKFKDSLYEVCGQIRNEFPNLKPPYFYVESVNETYNSNADDVIHAANLDMAFIDELESLGLPIKPVVFCGAVGNPHHLYGQYELLVPLARKCEQAGGLMGYHNYFLGNRDYGGPDHLWKYLAGRWTEMDEVFVQNDVHVKWYGGESGLVRGESGEDWVWLDPYGGWLSDDGYNGDWPHYLADLLRLDELIADWNKTHGDRYLGCVLFTSGEHYMGWDDFQIKQPQMQSLAAALLERYAE